MPLRFFSGLKQNLKELLVAGAGPNSLQPDLKSLLKRDFLHLAENLNLNILTPVIFYVFVGFEHYGLRHIIFLALYSIWIYSWDDMIEDRSFFRKRRLYVWFLTAASFALYPIITIMVLGGEVLINLNAIFRKQSYLFQLIEGPGNTLIYFTPYVAPINAYNPWIWIGVSIFFTGVDEFHKLGHTETPNRLRSFIMANILLGITGLLYGRWDQLYTWIFLILGASLQVGYLFTRSRGWYNLVHQSVFGPLGFLYFIWFLLPL